MVSAVVAVAAVAPEEHGSFVGWRSKLLLYLVQHQPANTLSFFVQKMCHGSTYGLYGPEQASNLVWRPQLFFSIIEGLNQPLTIIG